MTIGIWILGDQLNHNNSALVSCFNQQKLTPIILIESSNDAQQKRYHQQKLIFLWSAMRHFSQQLKEDGWQVKYVISEDFFTPLNNWLKEHKISELRIVEPRDRPFKQLINHLI